MNSNHHESSFESDYRDDRSSNEGSEVESSSSSEETSSSRSSSEEEDNQDGQWEACEEDFTLPGPIPVFEEPTGLKANLEGFKEPADFFNLFLDDKYLEDVCDYTDYYYKTYKEARAKTKNPKKKRDSHHWQWRKPDIIVLKAFLGILLLMGIIHKPRIEDYWSSSILWGTPGISEVMSHDQFRLILRNLAFALGRNKKDRLHKIRPLMEKIINTSRSLYAPKEFLSIDESMVKFNGRNTMKVFMPLKPIRYGFKVYMLTEASTGYVLSWVMHQGQKSTVIDTLSLLVDGYENKGFTISMDRFYTTIDAMLYLTDLGFSVYAAAMKNRIKKNNQMTKDLKALKKGEIRFYYSYAYQILLSCWYDSKVVLVLSNTGDSSLETVIRNRKDTNRKHKKVEIDCPQNICIYQKTARGVDHFDQMLSYYVPDHRSVKWYIRVCNHLLGVALHNSYRLYLLTQTRGKPKPYLEFVKSVIKSLIEGLRKRKMILPTPDRKSALPMMLEASLEDCKLVYSGQAPCVICALNKQKKRTNYMCKTHQKSVCILECYDFHRNNTHL